MDVPIKINGNTLERGDLFYEKRRLYRVEYVGKPRGKERTFSVKFKLIAKINLDRYARD
jgi:hypothetical protein